MEGDSDSSPIMALCLEMVEVNQAVGDAITDSDSLESGVVYEIKCHKCEMSILTIG